MALIFRKVKFTKVKSEVHTDRPTLAVMIERNLEDLTQWVEMPLWGAWPVFALCLFKTIEN